MRTKGIDKKVYQITNNLPIPKDTTTSLRFKVIDHKGNFISFGLITERRKMLQSTYRASEAITFYTSARKGKGSIAID